MGGVTVTLANGRVGGQLANNDGTCGIIMTGATEGTVTAGTPFLVTSEAEIDALGLTTGNNPEAVKFFSELVAELALLGINVFKLYVQLVADTMTIDDMCDVSNASGAKKMVDFATGDIRHIFALSDDSLVYPGGSGLVTTAGINADCYTAIANLHALCVAYAALPYNWPMRGCIAGTSFTGTATDLTDQTANTKNRVQLFIGDTASGDGCCLGIVVARRIALPIQRKISRRLNGPISSTTAYIATTTADQYLSTATITAKGIVTLKKVTSKTGFFFTGDNTCCATTDDYHTYPRGGVIDKAHRLVVDIYEEQTDDEVTTDDDGTIDGNEAGQLEATVLKRGKLEMVGPGNCTEVNASVDPNQNVESTGTVAIAVNVKGKGYKTSFDITLGFKPVES